MDAQNLEDLKQRLYRGFNTAMDKAESDFGYDNNASHHAAAQALTAAGTLALAIVEVDKRLDEAGKFKHKL